MKFSQYHGALLKTPEDPDHLYRPVPEYLPFCPTGETKRPELKLIFEKLQKIDFIVPFEFTGMSHKRFKNGDMLKIKKLPFDVRIQDLPKREACQLIIQYIDCILEMIPMGFIPWDVSESNILYWHNRAWFTDLGGFRETSKKAMNYAFIKAAYLFERYVKGNDITFKQASYHKMSKVFTGWFANQSGVDARNPAVWKRFKEIALKVRPPLYKKNHWADEYATRPTENKKLKKAIPLLEPTYGGTMLDVGTNKGYLCDFMSDKYTDIVGFDFVEKCIAIGNQLYLNQPNVTLTHMDIRDFFEHHDTKMTPKDRYQADTIIALAVTHHFEMAKINTVKVAEAFCTLAREWILLEEVGPKEVYHKIFKREGFVFQKRIDSYPESRKLSLWRRAST